MKSHRELIDQWESVGSFAREAHVKYFTVQGWRRRNNIPVDAWDNVVRAAQERGLQHVTRDWLYETRKDVSQNHGEVAA